MNRGYFQAISTASNESEFAFWIENQAHHPEVLRVLVERYANDIYQLGYIWIFGFQQEKPEKIQFTLFEYTQDVFSLVIDKLSDSFGQENVAIWLYGIAIKEAKRYHRKVAVRPTILFSRKQGKNQYPRENSTNSSFSKRLEYLHPRQRLILILRHTYRVDLSHIAAILRQNVPFVQYELSRARQILFEIYETENTEEFCSDPDSKYLIQAYHDGLLHSNEYMPLELESHLSECNACNRFNDNLIQLGETISSKLNSQPPNLFSNSSDCDYLVENIEKSSVNIARKVKKGMGFIRQSFVTIAIFIAIAFFAIQNIIQDTHKGMPVFSSTPEATPIAHFQLSESFHEIWVEQAQISQQTSINNLTPGTISVRIDGGGYCTIVTQDESLWLPQDKCLETYKEWFVSNETYKWFYSDGNGPVSHIKNLVFSPDGDTLAGLAMDSQIHIWQGEDGQLLKSIKLNPVLINNLAYSPDGNQIAIGLYNGTIQTITNLDSIQTILQNFRGPVFSLDYSPDGKTLTAGGKNFAWSFDLSKDKKYVLDFYPFPENQVTILDFSPNGDWLAFGLDDGTIWLYRFKDATPMARLNGHKGRVSHIVFSSDSNYLVSGATDNSVSLWDVSNISSVTKLLTLIHPDWITGLDVSPDGKLLATTSLRGNSLFLWSIPEGILLNKVDNDYFFGVSSITFSPDGSSLAIGSTNGSVKLWLIPHTNQSLQDR